MGRRNIAGYGIESGGSAEGIGIAVLCDRGYIERVEQPDTMTRL